MKKKIVSTLPVLNFLLILGLAACLVFTNCASAGSVSAGEKGTRYTLYIGLNDQDTYTQEISTEQAREIVDEICCKYVGGFTAFHAQGGWTDESDVLTRENTLVYMLSDAEESQITAIMDEVLSALNQSAILVHTDTVETVYYSGTQTET